nr:carbohydrate ABC transporter permease [Paenibacillus thiaminolyticus]
MPGRGALLSGGADTEGYAGARCCRPAPPPLGTNPSLRLYRPGFSVPRVVPFLSDAVRLCSQLLRLVSAQSVEPQVVFLPIYVQMSGWNLINTLWALILPFGASAFGIFLIRQAFMQIPEDMMEAARLDHATEWTIMWRIAVPMAKPAVTTFALFSLIYHWNDHFWPLIMTNQAAMRTLPVGIAMLKETEGIRAWNVLMAGNLMLVIPALLLFVLAQRHIMKAFVYTTK